VDFKRILFYFILILLLISIYKDLSIGSSINNIIIESSSPKTVNTSNFDIVQIKVDSGDTVLSIVEKVNNYQINHIDINKIITDFKQINPFVNPYHLKKNRFYFFPIYT